MEELANSSLDQIIRSNYKTMQLFEKYNIDFCTNGQMSLAEACQYSNVDISIVAPEVEELMLLSNPELQFLNELTLDALCDYIERRHHRYVTENIPFLQIKLSRLCEIYGQNHPELFKIKNLFSEAAENLALHMKKEEHILFPRIEKMAKYKVALPENPLEFGDVQNPIREMAYEHLEEDARFKVISELTHQFDIPSDACTTFRIGYESLREFEQDLRKHMYIENNILFKKAVEMEKELLTGQSKGR
jgi:regulator of cell morphogenesis and NO signaling